MTGFSKRTVLVLLALLVLVSLGLRYPLVEHERFQTDSYFVNDLANSIEGFGYAKWTFNPLSYLGLYPLSYPSGIPFLLAEMSSMTGMSVEACIILMDMGLAVLFCLTAFLFAREFVLRPELALLVAFFVTVGPRFVDTTYWNGSARGPEVVLLTLFVFMCFRMSVYHQKSLFVLGGLLLFTCLAVHHMGVLLLLYGVAFVLAAIAYRFMKSNVRTKRRRLVVSGIMIVGAGVMVSTLVYFEILGFSVQQGFGDSALFDDLGSPGLTMFVNAAVAYTHQVGFILPIAFLGMVVVFRRFYLTTRTLYPVTLILSFVPVVGSSLYVSMLISVFVSILGVIWLSRLLARPRMKVVAIVFVAVLVVGSLAFPVWSVDRWNMLGAPEGDSILLDDGMFNDGNYLRASCDGSYALSNRERLTLELQPMVDLRILRSGIRSTMNGDVTSQDMKANVTSSEADFPMNLYQWSRYGSKFSIDVYARNLMGQGVSYMRVSDTNVANYTSTHSKLYVVVDNSDPTHYTDMYGTYPAKLPGELKNAVSSGGSSLSCYMVYQSQTLSLYVVHLDESAA